MIIRGNKHAPATSLMANVSQPLTTLLTNVKRSITAKNGQQSLVLIRNSYITVVDEAAVRYMPNIKQIVDQNMYCLVVVDKAG